jgi:predicted metalloprotease
MRWQGRRESSNVDDRRGVSGGQIAVGGGLIGIIALLFNLFTGGEVDMSQLPIPTQSSKQLSPEQQAAQDKQAKFVKVVLQETENVWNDIFPKEFNSDYPEPTLVLFSGATQSGCGSASSSTGPFYCPGDQKVYIDLSFGQDLSNRFGVKGEFAFAYVVAHEVGHHIQTVLGISSKVARLRQQLSKEEYNKYSVMMELQADFLAGVWAHHIQGMGLLERGDIESALMAANAIGDDRLQKEAQGHAVPESFTHGTSEQRMYWFKKGFETGDIKQGDTFKARELQ